MTKDISLSDLIQQPESKGLREDAEQNRMLILQTADSLFQQNGVGNVSMADIAKSAGVGKGTLYRKFANKAELCYRLLDASLQQFQNSMIGRMEQLSAQGKSPMEQLDQFLDGLVYFSVENLPLLCEIRSGNVGNSPYAFNRPHYWMNITVRGLLDQAAKQNLIQDTLDTHYIADAIISPLDALTLQAQLDSGFTPDRISSGLRSFVNQLILM